MFTFRQFLDESSWSKDTLYHATYKDFDPKHITVGSHFGTLRASMHRAWNTMPSGYRLVRNDQGQSLNADNRLKVHAFKYTPKGRSIEMLDKFDASNTPDHKRIADHLANHKHIHPLEFLKARRGPQHLKQVLDAHNISSIHYKNRWEDPGSHSHIIFDTENLHHIKTFDEPKSLLLHHIKRRDMTPEKTMRERGKIRSIRYGSDMRDD